MAKESIKTILCYSGGLDSSLAKIYLKPDLVLYFDLNTKYSKKELKNIQGCEVVKRLDLKDYEIGDKAYVPFRNLFLVMLAYNEGLWNFPKAKKFRIAIVGVKGDKVEDKSNKAFKEMTKILNSLNKPNLPKIEIFSPFWGFTKGQLVRKFKDKVDFKKIVSCYNPGEGRCGECPACFRFWVALESNGIKCYNWFKKDIRKWKGIEAYKKNLMKYDKERRKEIQKVLNKYNL